MPDIFDIIYKRGKLILILTIVATAIALLVSLLSTKEYLATATALPANSVTADKARMFNSNIESLYPELGSPDELDRIEGTAQLDTLFIALADSFDLAAHYGIDTDSTNALYKAALALKKKSDIRRSAYGELKINVWNEDAMLAAQLANAILKNLNEIHQQLQNKNNALVLEKLRFQAKMKQKKLDSLQSYLDSLQSYLNNIQKTALDRMQSSQFITNDSADPQLTSPKNTLQQYQIENEQLTELLKLISQHELAMSLKPNVLIPVEFARAALKPDKPKTLQTTLFAFGASLIFSFLLALLAESRSKTS